MPSHEEVRAAFNAHAEKYPQYRSYASRLLPGVMERSFRKNGFTYLKRGDNVLFFRSPEKDPQQSTTVYGLTGISRYLRDDESLPLDFDSFAVSAHWVSATIVA